LAKRTLLSSKVIARKQKTSETLSRKRETPPRKTLTSGRNAERRPRIVQPSLTIFELSSVAILSKKDSLSRQSGVHKSVDRHAASTAGRPATPEELVEQRGYDEARFHFYQNHIKEHEQELAADTYRICDLEAPNMTRTVISVPRDLKHWKAFSSASTSSDKKPSKRRRDTLLLLNRL